MPMLRLTERIRAQSGGGRRAMALSVVGLLQAARRRLRIAGRRAHFLLNRNVLKNPPSRRRFAANAPQLNDVQHRILRDLTSLGVAFTTFTELFDDPERWSRLQQQAQTFIDGTDAVFGVGFDTRALTDVDAVAFLQHNLATATTYALTDDAVAKSDAYLVKLFPAHPTVALRDEWLQVGLDHRLLDVVNSYFGMWSKLTYLDLWRAIPVVHRNTRIGSQRWHRDPEDKKKLRIYLYLADVDSESGPLQYLPGSFSGGNHDKFWKWRLHGTHYPPQDEFERRFSGVEKITCTGTTGTLLLVDTNGFHRGGIAANGSRVLATWMFLSPASLQRRRFEIDWPAAAPDGLSDAARYAVT